MSAKKRKKASQKSGKKRRPKAKRTLKKKGLRRKGKGTKKKSARTPAKVKLNVVGVVTHYFPHVQAAVVKLKKPLATGDSILIKGTTTSFEQRVESMQIDHVPIEKAKKGDEIGLQVRDRVREHDLVLFPS